MAGGRNSVPFTMVRRPLWGSEKFMGLPDDAARYLYVYFLTSPHQTSTGCFALKEAYALADLDMTGSGWTPEKYRAAKDALFQSGLILTDDRTNEILIAQWWKGNGPNNERWFEGARKQCDAIQSLSLREAALEALEACWDEFQTSRARRAIPSVGQRTATGGAADERLRAVRERMGG